ncbi:MAG: hypothetical protein J6M56_05345 [Clostridia bacterium]|nr:hypothetical protein [Clostridia bacterium]
MSDRICIQTELMEEIRSQMLRLSAALSEFRGEIHSVNLDRTSGSDVKVQLSSGFLSCTGHRVGDGDVNECLQSLSRAADEMSRYTYAVAGSIGMVTDTFADTESSLVARFGGMAQGDSSLFQSVCKVLNINPQELKTSPTLRKKLQDLVSDGKLIFDGGMALLIHQGTNYLFDQNGLLASYEEKRGLSGIKQTAKIFHDHGVNKASLEMGLLSAGGKTKFKPIEQEKIKEYNKRYDKNGEEIKAGKEKEKLGQQVDVLSAGVKAENSVSAWYIEGVNEGERHKLEGNVGIGNAGAEASAVGGFGVYLPGKNGESQLYVGGAAEVGVSVSALEMQGSAEYELCDFIDLSAEGDVTMLSGELSAGAGLGIVGGKFVAYAEAGAEANLVEVNGEVGLDIGGVKGTVGAGVQVGIGASAKAGYKEGVISFDASISVGVGVSVNVELDISGAIDSIGNALESVGDAASSFTGGLLSVCCWWG